MVKKSAYISLAGQYFSDKSFFSIRSLKKKYRTWMCFFRFILKYFQFFSMIIALILSWWNLRSSTVYPFPSMKNIYHRHCGKASSIPTILTSVDLLPFIFCFHDIFIFDPDPMYIITPVCPLQYGCAAKDAPTHHLMTLRLLALSMSGRYRVPLMYLITLTGFPQSSSADILTRVHSK